MRASVAAAAATAAAAAASRVTTADFVVIGAGIVGVNIAAVLCQRRPDARIVLLEKEAGIGWHASGRNSGVLHSGVYYGSDTLKARFSQDGNAFLADYCTRKGLPLSRCGKLIVAKSEAELAGLDTLLARGRANGVPVEEVSEEQAARLEPLVRTHKRALWSPSTAVADPGAVLRAQAADLAAAGVQLRTGAPVARLSPVPASGPAGVACVRVELGHPGSNSSGSSGAASEAIEAGHVINAAGLHADTLAAQLPGGNPGGRFALLPFVGLYMYCDAARLPLRRLVYPVPDLGTPFLGVHFTVTVDGKVKIGPTAIPALWREMYADLPPPSQVPDAAAAAAHDSGFSGIAAALPPAPGGAAARAAALASRFSLAEAAEVGGTLARLAAARPEIRRLALAEARKHWKPWMTAGAAALLRPGAADDPQVFTHYGRPGIRAQLVDLQPQAEQQAQSTQGPALVMDFVVTGGGGARRANRRSDSLSTSMAGTTAGSECSGGGSVAGGACAWAGGDGLSTHVLNAISPAWTCSRPFAGLVVDRALC